jgi:hypothetical protein
VSAKDIDDLSPEEYYTISIGAKIVAAYHILKSIDTALTAWPDLAKHLSENGNEIAAMMIRWAIHEMEQHQKYWARTHSDLGEEYEYHGSALNSDRTEIPEAFRKAFQDEPPAVDEARS